MAVITIADDGNSIKFTKDSLDYFVNKSVARVTGNSTTEQIYIHDAKSQILDFNYSEVTSPAEANYIDLINFIQDLLDAAGVLPVGAATEAKQDTQIALLELMDGDTSTTSSVAASLTSVNLKAANTDRVKLVVYNDGIANLYVKEGATASATDFTYKLAKGDTLIIDDYTGIVDGIWDVANGSARITETV